MNYVDGPLGAACAAADAALRVMGVRGMYRPLLALILLLLASAGEVVYLRFWLEQR